MAYREMNSKYPGKCKCGGQFRKGAKILYSTGLRRVVACPVCQGVKVWGDLVSVKGGEFYCQLFKAHDSDNIIRAKVTTQLADSPRQSSCSIRWVDGEMTTIPHWGGDNEAFVEYWAPHVVEVALERPF